MTSQTEAVRQQSPMWDLLQAYGDACEAWAYGEAPRETLRATVNAAWERLWEQISAYDSAVQRAERAEQRYEALLVRFENACGENTAKHSRILDLEEERDAATSREAALREALHSLVDLYARPGESNLDRFERVAEMFYRETGCMAPGKDVAAASGDSMSQVSRVAKWEQWYADRADRARQALAGKGEK